MESNEGARDPQWLDWAHRLQAIAQNGLHYNQEPFDVDRYRQVQRIAAEILEAYSDTDADTILDLFRREEGHATPKVDVRGVVFRGDEVLLVKERSDGLWSLPGGWADLRDTPSEAAVREIREETGYETQAVKLLALLDRSRQGHPASPWYSYKAFFLCRLLGGSPRGSYETEDVGFFAEDALPPLSLQRVTRPQMARLFEHHRNPDLPADFD